MDLQGSLPKMCQDNKYKRRHGTSSIIGQLYEVRLEMLYLLKGIRKHKGKKISNFRLATNMEKAGSFDDIVFKYEYKNLSGKVDTKVIFLQAKHKEDPIKYQISLDVLPSGSKKKEFFKVCLKDYFKSYREIRQTFPNLENCEFIIYTNASADDNFCKNKNIEEINVSEDDILNFTGSDNYHGRYFKFKLKVDENILRDLLKPPNPDPTPTIEEAAEFLGKLKIYVDQPNNDQLGEILKENIKSAFVNENLEENVIKHIFLDIQDKLQQRPQKEVEYLTETCTFFDESKQKLSKLTLTELAEQFIEKVKKLQIRFNLNQIKDRKKLIRKNQLCNIITNNKSTLLSTAKVYQTLQSMSEYCSEKFDNYILLSLSSILGSLDKVIDTFKTETTNLLVIECDSTPNTDDVEKLYKALSNIVQSNTNKKIVLITKEGDYLSAKFKAAIGVEKYEEIIDSMYGLIDLTKESQDTLLKNCTVSFQGEEVSLETVIDEEAVHLIDSEVLTDLINKVKIDIGKALTGLGDVEDFYIDRTFRRFVQIKDECFKNINRNDIFVISNTTPDGFSKFVHKSKLRKYEKTDPNEKNPIRFIILDDDEKKNQNFEQLCIDYKEYNIHWLKQDGPLFIWQKSHGALESLRTFVDKSSGNEYQEDEITTIADKVMILSSEAGMGKSTIISKLALRTKTLNNSLWVIKINLSEHSEKLATTNFNGNEDHIINFLLDITKTKAKLEKALFKNRMKNTGKLVIYFDGFDEISPNYEEKVVKILTFLKSTKVEKLWITTRPHTKYQLEDKLGKLSYNLKPFSKDNQKQFLMKFWGKNLNLDLNVKASRTNIYIEELLGVLKNSIADYEVKFTGIPLQTRMMAEIFQKDFGKYYSSIETETNLPNKLNLLNLYKLFIKKKFVIYCIEKKKENLYNPHVKNDAKGFFKIFYERHKLLALNLLFEEKINILLSTDEQNKLEEAKTEENIKGIINEIIDGTPSFIHRTFAEFFAAKWFAENHERKEVKDILRTILFRNIFLYIGDVFSNFFNRILADDGDDSYDNDDGYDCLVIVSDKYELHNAVLSKDEEKIIKLLSNPLKREDIINRPDKGGRTALHLAALYEYENIASILLDYGISFSSDTIFKWTPLRYAWEIEDCNTVELLLKNKANFEDVLEGMFGYKLYCLTREVLSKGDISLLKCLVEKLEEIIDKHYIMSIVDHDLPELLEYALDTHAHLWVYKYYCLFKAADDGRIKIMKFLVEKGIDLNIPNDYGSTIAHIAAEKGNKEMVKLLLDNGADLHVTNSFGQTPFQLFLEKGEIELIQLLIEKNTAFVNTADDNGKTSAHFAAVNGDVKIMDLLLIKGAKLNVKDNSGMLPFHVAVLNDRIELVKYLLEKNDDFINVPVNNGRTSVHFAAEYGDVEIMKLLITKGAKLNVTDNEGKTPFHFAVKFGHVDLVEYLIEQNRGLINIADNNGRTSVHFAAEYGDVEIMKLQLKKGAKLNVKDNKGLFPFHVAVLHGRIDLVEYFLEKNADFINVPVNDGRTSVHFAAENGELETMKILLENKGNLNVPDNKGVTPFHEAVKFGNIDLVKYLIEQDAYIINIADKKGRTSIHFAAKKGNLEIVKLLIEKGANINVTDYQGRTPLRIANQFSKIKLVEYLTEKTAALINIADKNGRNSLQIADKINVTDNEGDMPFLDAVILGNIDLVSILVEQNADLINIPDNNGRTSVHIAAEIGEMQMMKLLITKGAKLDVIDNEGKTPFHVAVKFGHVDLVEYLIEQNRDLINIADNNGRNSVHYAAENVEMQIMKLLIEKDADLTVRDNNGETPFHFAVRFCNTEIVGYLVKQNADLINIADNTGKTPVHIAAEECDIQLIAFLLENGADLQVKDKEGITPFHKATKNPNENIFKYLIQKNADLINIADNSGRTFVHVAAEDGNSHAMKLLLTKGADLTVRNNRGVTPFHVILEFCTEEYDDFCETWTLKEDRVELIKYLIKKSADQINISDYNGRTSVHIAAEKCKIEVMEILLENGGRLDVRDKKGMIPFHKAFENDNKGIVEYLIQKNPDLINIADNDGRISVHFAAKKGKIKIMKLLLEKGGVLDVKDNKGETPFHIAVKFGHIGLVKYLIQKSTDLINIGDNDGRTSHHYAAKKGDTEIMKLLLEKEDVLKVTDNDGKIPFHVAVEFGRKELVEYLMDKNADFINIADKNGKTAVDYAAGNTEIKKLLDEKIAELSAKRRRLY